MKVLWESIDELDVALQQRVADYLNERDPSAFRGMQIDVQSGAVTLTGCLRTYYERQIAVAYCRTVPGVLAILDCLSVADWDVERDEYPFGITQCEDAECVLG